MSRHARAARKAREALPVIWHDFCAEACRLALFKARGSARAIFHILRDRHGVELNNNWSPEWAATCMDLHPHLAGWFETRTSRAEHDPRQGALL